MVIHHSPLLFLIGCIGLRSALAWTSYAYAHTQYIKPLRAFSFLVGTGFWWLWLTNSRLTGRESSAPNKTIWWNWARPIFGTLWLLHALTGDYRYLVADVAFGLALWLWRK